MKRRYDRAIIGSDSGVIVLDDSFQRNNVWSRKQKSQLIESLLLGIPIPYLYVYEGKNSNLIVIDGRQRLSAIFDFLDNKFALVGLEFLKHLNGKKIKDFTNSNKGQYEKYKANLEDAHLHVIRVGYETSEIFKLKIFQRVNQGGTKLNNQELRHALHQGASTVLLKELSKDIDIQAFFLGLFQPCEITASCTFKNTLIELLEFNIFIILILTFSCEVFIYS